MICTPLHCFLTLGCKHCSNIPTQQLIDSPIHNKSKIAHQYNWDKFGRWSHTRRWINVFCICKVEDLNALTRCPARSLGKEKSKRIYSKALWKYYNEHFQTPSISQQSTNETGLYLVCLLVRTNVHRRTYLRSCPASQLFYGFAQGQEPLCLIPNVLMNYPNIELNTEFCPFWSVEALKFLPSIYWLVTIVVVCYFSFVVFRLPTRCGLRMFVVGGRCTYDVCANREGGG